MEATDGAKVKIRYKCRLHDGRLYLVGVKDTLEFVMGAGSVPPSLEMGLQGMRAKEHRSIMVPAAEVNHFPFPRGSHFAKESASSLGTAYDFGPGNGGDVSLELTRPDREPIPAGEDMYFDVEMLAVERHH